jgi:hypothetical protein
VGFETLLVMGSAKAFDLEVGPDDVRRIFVLAQVWNSWSVAMRRDTRFKEWLETVGFVEFWEKYGWPDRCQPTGNDSFDCV